MVTLLPPSSSSFYQILLSLAVYLFFKVLWCVVPEVVRYVVTLKEAHHENHVDSRLELALKVVDHNLQLLKNLATKLAQRLGHGEWVYGNGMLCKVVWQDLVLLV